MVILIDIGYSQCSSLGVDEVELCDFVVVFTGRSVETQIMESNLN
jgi:hypothetical protein